MLRTAMIATFMLLAPGAAMAQSTDPVAVGQILTQRGTMEGYVDRARARQRGEAPQKATTARCDEAWKLRDRMTRPQRRRLYELCPR